MEKYIENTIRAYDDADTYQAATEKLSPTPEIDKLLEGLADGARVLDVGCAFGRDAEYIAAKGFNVAGLDLSESLIKRAKERNPDIEFVMADMRKTPFADGTVDAIWSHAALLHLKDEHILEALEEFKRILVPGGVIAISFKEGEHESTFTEKFSSDSERYFNFQTDETFGELLEQAGFELVGSHLVNEQERWGEEKRDLNWLFTYARMN